MQIQSLLRMRAAFAIVVRPGTVQPCRLYGMSYASYDALARVGHQSKAYSCDELIEVCSAAPHF